MTSRTDSFPTSYAPAQRFRWGRLSFTFAVTLSAIIVFGASFALGYDRMNAGRVLPGVEVDGVDLAGLNRSAAGAKLRETLPDLSTGNLTIRVGNLEQSIPYADFDRNYNLNLMLDQAFELGRGSNFVEQLREQVGILMNGATVEPQVTWDNKALAERVATLAASAEVAPVDAAVSRENGRYVVTPSSPGLTVDLAQVVSLAMAAVNNLSTNSTDIAVEGSPVAPDITTEEAQAAVDRAENVVSQAMTISGEELTATIDADTLRGWVHLDEIARGEWQVTIESVPITQFLTSFAAETDIAPTNASFDLTSTETGATVSVVPSALGRALDIEASTSSVMAALSARVESQAVAANLALAPVDPEFTTAQAQALAPNVTMLGTWTTNYIPQASNGFGVNIQLPTTAVDGYVVQPGERFDYLTAIGEVTSPPYVEGGVLIHGQIKPDGAIGGGMCSSSTTLFNAAMRAGFQIDARGNHSIYIGRYPVGLDATVWELGGSRRTMAFTNDTAYPMLVKGINATKSVTFEVWGIDDGRTVELSEPRIENLIQGGSVLEYTDELPAGERKEKQDAYDSFDSWVTRTVRDAAGNVIHSDEFFSHYKKLDQIILVGRYVNDPPAGTQIPNGPQPDPSPTNPPPVTPDPNATPAPEATATPTPTP
ncbi:MAG: peptidoglycan binding domain-containing protein [Candidatus Limnocylindrales bacterium]